MLSLRHSRHTDTLNTFLIQMLGHNPVRPAGQSSISAMAVRISYLLVPDSAHICTNAKQAIQVKAVKLWQQCKDFIKPLIVARKFPVKFVYLGTRETFLKI